MTNEDLQAIVEATSLEYFERPFVHQAIFNKRLRTTGGRYLLQTHDIEINPHLIEAVDDDTVLIGIIKHELIHYHLHTQGLPHQHRDREFRNELKRIDAPRFAPSVPERYKWHYQCENGHHVYRMRRIDIRKYVCGRCGSKLKLISENS